MFRIIDSKATGKTSKLMSLASDNNGILVCSDPHCMLIKAHSYGIKGFDIISYEDYRENQYDHNKPVFIDELEKYISSYHRIDGYSLSNED
jgi:hypothetical protein